jgi:hypothetical protein
MPLLAGTFLGLFLPLHLPVEFSGPVYLTDKITETELNLTVKN